MKFVNRFILSLAALVLILAAISLFLPDKYYMQRTITINTSDTVVYNLLSSMRNVTIWSPWHILDTNVIYSYYGPNYGVGSAVNWTSEKDNLTSAEIKIEKVIPNKLIDMFFAFSKQGEFELRYSIDKISSSNCKLTMEISKDIGYNLPFRYYALMYNYYMTQDFDTALNKIKIYSEKIK